MPAAFTHTLRALDADRPRRSVRVILFAFLLLGVWILSWWLLGRAALEGRLDRGWLLG